MKIAMINYVVYWLNVMPKHDQRLSPRDIIMGEEKLDYKKVCQLPFGAYVQVHDDLDVANTMESRTTGALHLGPTGNLQGAHQRWTELPVPFDVIHRVEEMAGESEDVLSSLMTVEEDDYDHGVSNSSHDMINGENSNEDTYETVGEVVTNNDFGDERLDIDDEVGATQNELVNNNEENEPKGDRNAVTHNYSLRENRRRDYSHCFAFLSVNAGLKIWGD